MLNTSNIHPTLAQAFEQAASPVSLVDTRLNKLVATMVESHFLTLVADEEIEDFLTELEVLGFGSVAKKIRSEMSISRAEYGRKIKGLAESDENGLD